MKNISIFLMMLCFACFGVANAQQSLPYSYGFENNNLATDGWTTQNPSGLNASEFGIIGTAAQNGSYGFRFSSYSDRGESTQYLISPELVAPNGVIVQFYYKASSSYTDGETFQVGYSTTDDNISSFTFGSENNATNTSWEQTEELVFPAGTKYVAVYYSANYQYRLYVDNFSFEENLPCAKPENLSVTTDGQTATVTWDGTASNNFIVTVNGTPASGQTSPYTFNVALSTTYNISVTANCGSDGLSSPVSTSFTTPDCIGGHTINYTLNDSYGDGWNGNAIQIFDGCGDLVETLTIASGSTNSGTLVLCGDYYQFVWHTGSFASETSFTLTDNGTALYSNQAGSSLTDGQVLYTIGIQPPVMPTALTAGTPGTNEVQLSWTENGTATTWQICINDDENNLVVANSNPFTLTGLDAVTPYTVKVRSTDGTSVSCWSNAVSFTTDSQCPTPNGLNVTNLMPTSATLNWEGDDDVESYNVRYRTAASSSETTTFSEDFENGIPATWTTIDGDDDGNNWLALSEVSTVYTSYSGTMSDWAHSGNNAATSPSFANSVGCFDSDQWLITPQVNLGGTLKFYAASTYSDLDAFEVLLSTSGTAISDFTTTLQTMHDAPYALNDGTDDWEEVTIDLSSYSGQGYIAIHHVSNCMYFLVIDDFAIYANEPAGEWLPNATGASTSDNSLPITGLTPETTYEFQVQADCGTDGESNWSNIATFTTPDACAVPTGLTAEVTGNAAELSWTGVQENYNVQYREVDPTVPATIILNVPNDIWNDGTGYQMLLDADATAYGDVFTATGSWTATDYSAFEYLIPTDAECSADATHIVLENSVSIQIPAGTYDWCIVNPSPTDSKIYIAASNGNVGGRQDDYVFESGMTYEFTPSLFGINDGVDVTITDNNEWTLVEGVTNPYTLTNLSAQTTYKYKVQGVDCDGNNGTTEWSEIVTLTTGEFYTLPIEAYNGDNNGWYLIASPVATTPDAVENMLSNTYDLYRFNQSAEMEWENYQQHQGDFNIVPGQGYLYANSEDVELVFSGTPYSGNGEIDLVYDESVTDTVMRGLNLVGNPFNERAYVDRDFYVMNNGQEIIAATEADRNYVEPMEGIFVYSRNPNDPKVTFSTTAPNGSKGALVMNVGQGNVIDRAIVRFGGNNMPKFQLFENSTKLYIAQDGEDYAIVNSGNEDEMPVNFKAEKNGTYTISVNTENVEFGYLHLIDNKTGNDVDLLANPSYTFEAKTTDYASRFRLVFSAEAETESFAYYNGSEWVVNGKGTMQLVDMMGRVLSSENVNGVATVNTNELSAGMYVMRLVNGNDVKTQKIVVR